MKRKFEENIFIMGKKQCYENDIIINDIKIICNLKELKLEEYSNDMIKSGNGFNIRELFKIKEIIIEGEHIYIQNMSQCMKTFENCQPNGLFKRVNANGNREEFILKTD